MCAGWRSRFSGTSVVGLSVNPLSDTGTRLLRVGSSLVLETGLTRVPGDVKIHFYVVFFRNDQQKTDFWKTTNTISSRSLLVYFYVVRNIDIFHVCTISTMELTTTEIAVISSCE